MAAASLSARSTALRRLTAAGALLGFSVVAGTAVMHAIDLQVKVLKP